MDDIHWTNAGLLLLLVAGHTEILVTLVNRVHALPIACGTLRHIRHVHDVLLPAFPVVLLWFVGLSGPRLLFGGSWSDVPVGWRMYLAVCGLGTIGLLHSSARYRLSRRSAAVASDQSRVVDVEKEFGRRPLGDGPFRWLTGVPFNQIFEIEVNTRELRLSRLPDEWDGLTITHLSDWHIFGTLDRSFFARVTELAAEQSSDMIVFTGDLLDRQSLIEWIPETLGKLSAPLGCRFVLGNHDWYLDDAAIRRILSEHGWEDVSGRVVTTDHRGRILAVGGSERPWMGMPPDFSQAADQAGDQTQTAAGDSGAFRILLSHTPDNIGWARRHAIDLMLAGHNHGGQVVLPVIGPVYSPSLTGCKYASGTFPEEPTVLHVSRGISGRHPLRINCRPEVTQLVLRPRSDSV